MDPTDEIFEQFLREYLRLAPEQRRFARRVMRALADGLGLDEAIRSAAD